jgi:hypothetical protein
MEFGIFNLMGSRDPPKPTAEVFERTAKLRRQPPRSLGLRERRRRGLYDRALVLPEAFLRYRSVGIAVRAAAPVFGDHRYAMAGGSEIRTIGPSRKESRFRALITRNSLTITLPHFRLGSIPYASRESREQ